MSYNVTKCIRVKGYAAKGNNKAFGTFNTLEEVNQAINEDIGTRDPLNSPEWEELDHKEQEICYEYKGDVTHTYTAINNNDHE